jgi:hypothetical protein
MTIFAPTVLQNIAFRQWSSQALPSAIWARAKTQRGARGRKNRGEHPLEENARLLKRLPQSVERGIIDDDQPLLEKVCGRSDRLACELRPIIHC